MTVILTVTCASGHIVGTYENTIEEKYPFWCQECDDFGGGGDLRMGKYPWTITTEVKP
ncbi:MAG TPA: hypothetical protein VMV17_18075 [Streptosporangiaceae bacterium]|nr:hypothetical protein [Streptosporangiaceae bacterium]